MKMDQFIPIDGKRIVQCKTIPRHRTETEDKDRAMDGIVGMRVALYVRGWC